MSNPGIYPGDRTLNIEKVYPQSLIEKLANHESHNETKIEITIET